VSPNSGLIRQWREEYARCMLQLDFEPIPDTAFHASTVGIAEGVRIVKSSFSPGFTIRDEELVKDGDDSFAFLISRSKNITVDKKYQQFQLGHGDAALLRVCEPGVLGAKARFDYVAMILPSIEMQTRLSKVDGVLRQRLSKTSEGLQLLRTYVRALETAKHFMSMNARATIQRHFFDLAALAFETQTHLGESTLSAIAAARLYAAEEIIKSRFDEPDISVDSVANALNISVRYLQRLFHQSDSTFTVYVNGLRLDRAHELLIDRQWEGKRISDIALHVGFSDVSYFDRLFKQRFAASPSEIRAEAAVNPQSNLMRK
jgi:AraC-like DNA-binding protein